MLNYRISQSQLAKLEEVSRPVDLLCDKRFTVAIRNDGLGFNLIEADKNGTSEYAIHKDMIPVLKEAIWIWEHIKDGVSFDSLHPEKKLRIIR